MLSYLQSHLPLFKSIAIAIGILAGGWIAAKWTHRLLSRGFAHRKIDEALARFLATIAQYTVLAAAIITALGAVGIQTTSLVAIFASAGLAIGLALQGSLGSFASGVMILFFRPFNLGDKVTAAGQTGVVHDVGLFATTLLTADNETIIIPNSQITSATIMNFTRRGTLRGHIDITVAPGTDLAKAMMILQTAASRAELVLADPGPAVAIAGLGPRGPQLTVFAWSKAEDYLGMLHNLRRAVYDDLATAGISAPQSPVVVAA